MHVLNEMGTWTGLGAWDKMAISAKNHNRANWTLIGKNSSPDLHNLTQTRVITLSEIILWFLMIQNGKIRQECITEQNTTDRSVMAKQVSTREMEYIECSSFIEICGL